MLPFHHNVRKTIDLAYEINNTKACNCCYKGTMFLHDDDDDDDDDYYYYCYYCYYYYHFYSIYEQVTQIWTI